MRQKLAALVAALALCALAWWLPSMRRTLIRAMTTYDAVTSEPPALPGGTGPGLTRTPRTRVVLIDGLATETAVQLPTWKVLCFAGTTLDIDVGFPTVSLPVEVALWTGLTQQQTGVVANRAFDPPIKGIPSQVPGSIAIAENHGYIVRALGFAKAEPAAEPGKPMKDANEKAWDTQWLTIALEAVRSSAPLVFVHILRVDVAGHKSGMGAEYSIAARDADGFLDRLVQADPGARWFLLSDHGHIEGGGHGGEEREVRHVQGCVTGAGINVEKSGLISIIDVSRAIADSVGATLDPASHARPFSVALATKLGEDQAVPALSIGLGMIAIFILVLGLGAVTWGVRRWWLAPWWFLAACGALIAIRGVPTLSTPMIYKPEGRDMWLVWAPTLILAMVATWLGLRKTTLVRVIVGQLALPLAVMAAVITTAGAWSAAFGVEVAPVVPHFSAWTSPIVLMVAHGAGAVGLAVLASVALQAFGRRGPPEPPRSAPVAE